MNDLVFYFEGIQRLDWGLGNPNKTATLIAELMIVVWALTLSRKIIVFACGALLFAALGCCLALTYSRGGLLACAAGLSLLAFFSPKPWAKGRKLALLLCMGVIVGYMVHSGASRRYVQGIGETDHSILNRLEVWKTAPRMMVDAPHGWGLGQSGQAYLQWYQPTEREQAYRTLVNSHLTWLVEGGWCMRYLYVAGWMMAFILCFVKREQRFYPVPFAVWLVFALSAFFSSVAEAVVLWVIPVVCLSGSLLVRIKDRQPITRRQALASLLVPLMVCLALFIAGHTSSPLRIRKTREALFVGAGVPEAWLILDTQKLSAERWPRTVRDALRARGEDVSLAVGGQIRALAPRAPKRIVIWGRPSNIDSKGVGSMLPASSQLVLYAPPFYPQEVDPGLRERFRSAQVYFGEFSQSLFLSAWENESEVIRVPASGDYFPNWPDLLFKP